jgi:spore germination cell wall hydrolase CwlJ-like protein
MATLLGAHAAQAQDHHHAASGPRDLQIVVAEGAANGPITLPATGPATTTLPPARGMLALAPAPAANATAATLTDLVDATPMPAQLSAELECLAGAVYFESKGESLAGQLAVARVIVARSQSGRYPASYCGVVYQPSQFSFVRGHAMPAINRGSRFWANAVRIAVIADQGAWKSPAEGALFFHAARVAPGWGKTRLAAIGGHVFYR